MDLYYPEYLLVTVVLRAPRVAKMGWSMIRGLLSKDVQERVHLLGGAAESSRVMLQLASPTVLPTAIGGQRDVWDDAWRESIGLDDPEIAAHVAEGAQLGKSVLKSFLAL